MFKSLIHRKPPHVVKRDDVGGATKPETRGLDDLTDLHPIVAASVAQASDGRLGAGNLADVAEVPATSSRPAPIEARIVALLARPGGSSIADLMVETGWQAHSLRAVLSRLRSKGQRIERRLDEGRQGSVYSTAAADAGAASTAGEA